MNMLSPLSAANFLSLLRGDLEPTATPSKRQRRAIRCWKCPECYYAHNDEEAAEDCCALPAAKASDDLAKCPICGASHLDDYWAAVDCCLWKDIDMPVRARIAARMDSGNTSWQEQLAPFRPTRNRSSSDSHEQYAK